MSHHHSHCHCQPCCNTTKDASCCSGQQHHSCGSCCESSHSSCHEGKCDHKNKFLALANEAWMEVFKEKIKDEIRKNSQHLDELARLVSEANKELWRCKIEGHRTMGNYDEKMMQFFNCGSQSCEKKRHNH